MFLKAGGTLIRRELRDGEQLRISSGCLVGFSSGVDYGRSIALADLCFELEKLCIRAFVCDWTMAFACNFRNLSLTPYLRSFTNTKTTATL